jgi:bacillithiol system protein YtxJ
MDQELKLLRGIDELEQTLNDSHVQPVLLFKHSYTCGISAEALDELRAHLEERRVAPDRAVQYAMVTVQTHREVSNAISARLGVRHETPQAILVSGGRAIWSASHFRVNAMELSKAIQTRFVGS